MTDLIAPLDALDTYMPPGHSGTTNRRLVEAAATGGGFEMVHGRLEPGGHAARHHHDRAFQAMYLVAGAAEVAIGDAAPETVRAPAIVRIPPGTEHEVTSLGPDDLELILVYSPPISGAP